MTPSKSPRARRAPTSIALRRSLIGAFLAPLLVLGVVAAPAANATFPGSNGRIVFDTADGPDGSQIYSIEPDGSGLVQLTQLRRAVAFMPRWSANGRRIAYVSDASGNDELWTMRADGSRQRQVTDEPGVGHYWPTWAPGGGIVYSRCDFTAFGTCTISAVRPDGSKMRTIVGGHWHHGQPAVSPDGTWIAFTSDKGGYDSRLWLVRPDGSDLHFVGDLVKLVPDRPDWSPDGSHLTFTGDPRSGKAFTIEPDGSDLTSITPVPVARVFAFYSPDGAQMAVLHDADSPDRTLIRTDTDGNEIAPLTSIPGITFADWGVAS